MASAPLQLEVRGELDQYRSEELVQALSGRTPPAHVVIDLQACTRVASGAGWRLGNAIRRIKSSGGQLEIRLPVPLSSPSRAQDSWIYLYLSRSGLGYAIADYATRILDAENKDVLESIRSYYQTRDQHSNNAIGVYSLEMISDLVVDQGICERVTTDWLEHVRAGTDPTSTTFDAIRLLCWEALTNIDDHADRQPLEPGTPVLGSFSMRWYSRRELLSAQPGLRYPWLQSTLDTVGVSRASESVRGFVEVVVADDGVGIAARQSQDASIYWGARDVETDALVAALADAKSIKPSLQDARMRGDPGYGFTHIQGSLRKLGAWAALRTGRLIATCDASPKGTGTFALRAEALAYMPGTALEVLIPARTPPPPRRRSRSGAQGNQLRLWDAAR